ncbi:MAG: DNA polymerase III subunit gamma/tau, partial [Raoultibacter sp.]
ETGADLAQFTRDLAEHIRNMYILTLSGTDTAIEVSEATRRELTSEMELFGPDRLARLLGVLGDLSAELKTSTNPRLSFEIALTRMVRPDSDLTLASLAERVEALESGYSAVAHVVSAPAQAHVASTAIAASAPVAQQAAVPVAQPVTQTAPEVSAPAATPVPAFDPAVDANSSAPAPEPEAAPVSATPAASASGAPASGLDNPAALQRIWQAALSSIKKAKAAYGVLFLNTKAVHDASRGGIIIEFPKENAFAFTAVQKPEVIDVVKTALMQAAGGEVAFRFEQATAAAKPAAGAATPAPVAATSAPAAAVAAVAPVAVAASAPVPTATAAPATNAAAAPVPASAAFEAPEPESIPLDAYAAVPSDYEPEPAPASSAAPTAASAPGSDSGDADMEAILAMGFGDGVSFQEVE